MAEFLVGQLILMATELLSARFNQSIEMSEAESNQFVFSSV